MRLIIILISFLASFGPNANPKVDSLENVLTTLHVEDETRVDVLNQLGYEYWIINPIQSIIYGQQAKALAEVLAYEEGLAFSNRVIGVAHWARGSYDQGLEYLLEGLEMYRAQKDTLGEGNCLMNIGLIYSDRQDNDLALKYYFDALKLFEAVDAKARSATTYVKLATVFIWQGQFDAANDFLVRAEKIHGNIQFMYGMAEVLGRYGELKLAQKQYDSASIYLKHSQDISKKIQDNDGLARSYIHLAEVAMKQNDFTRAEGLLKEGLVYARQIQSHKWLKEIYDRLRMIAREKGDLTRALQYYDQYIQERDSIFNEQTLNNIARLESELATAEQRRQIAAKEQEILLLEQQSALQRTKFIIVIIVSVVVILVLVVFAKLRQVIARRNEEKAHAETEKARRELEFKNKELTSYTVNFIQKNQLFEELVNSISLFKKKAPDDLRKELIGMERIIKRHIQVDRDWEDFKLRFEHLHTGFFDALVKQNPSLTNNDLKLSALIKMNFSIKEVAEMMGISTESVKTARYRLKKKLGLDADTSVNDFLNSIG
ncbi:MAG: hypothetical protein Tsb0034_30120 [Ekhidna sp.]